jgi:hypothetical protein
LPNELLSKVVEVCDESDLIYYDKGEKCLARQDTYLAECQICNFINEKLNNTTKLDINYTQYKNVDGFELTDMQLLALKNFCESNVSILSGVSGAAKRVQLRH